VGCRGCGGRAGKLKFLSYGKDGGAESSVSGFWLVEVKSLFSIVLLRFQGASRDAYHEHAFNSISWVLRGKLEEDLWSCCDLHSKWPRTYTPSLRPVITRRNTFHKVDSHGTTWVLSLRGPWSKTWQEYLPAEGRFATLTHGRKEVAS
jgi:hypothetical protein